jgi:hypothetical protein
VVFSTIPVKKRVKGVYHMYLNIFQSFSYYQVPRIRRKTVVCVSWKVALKQIATYNTQEAICYPFWNFYFYFAGNCLKNNVCIWKFENVDDFNLFILCRKSRNRAEFIINTQNYGKIWFWFAILDRPNWSKINKSIALKFYLWIIFEMTHSYWNGTLQFNSVTFWE